MKAIGTYDTQGMTLVFPHSWPHAYTYTATEQLFTDTITNPETKEQFVKTYTWKESSLVKGKYLPVAESGWELYEPR